MPAFFRLTLTFFMLSGEWRLVAQPQLGSVVDSNQECQAGPLTNTVCRQLLVACDGLKTIEAEIRITGGTFYAPAEDVQGLVSDHDGLPGRRPKVGLAVGQQTRAA
jgi:hypothetical protein